MGSRIAGTRGLSYPYARRRELLKRRSRAQLKCVEAVDQIVQRYGQSDTGIATAPINEIAGVNIVVGCSNNHPRPWGLSAQRFERGQAIPVREIRHYDQRKEERFSQR